MAVSQEAVEFYRGLTAAQPEAFTPDLAMSLTILANCLSAIGRLEAALTAAQEAVELRRGLAAARPEAFTAELATSLNTLAIFLSDLGRREEALAVAQEVLELRRGLAAARPEAFAPDLAVSLSNLANFLSALGRPEKAQEAAQEAVVPYRGLAAARPEVFNTGLAASLTNLANCLSALGDRENALAAAQEAVDRLISPQFVTPYVTSNKNDRNDAEAICEAIGRPSLRFVPPKSSEQLAIQAVHRIRQRLVSDRTRLVNRIRGLLAEHVIARDISRLRHALAGSVSKRSSFALCSDASVRYAEAPRPQGDLPCPASIRPNSAACLPA